MERDYQEVYKKFSNNALKRGPGQTERVEIYRWWKEKY